MADPISLVKGDSLANLSVTLVREDTGGAFAATSGLVKLYIRKKGTTSPVTTVTHSAGVSDLPNGLVIFPLGTFTQSADAGYYEAEVEIIQNSGLSDETKQTVFEALSILVRDDFA